MITDNGKHYLYRHIRKDKDIPFYIGIGTRYFKTKESIVNSHIRAIVYHEGNEIWSRIIKKTKYDVEILMYSNDYDFIKQKENEFIKIHGRIDKGTGTLANMTDGGEGLSGKIFSKEHKEKIRQKLIGVNAGSKNKRSRVIYQYTLEGKFVRKFDTISDAAKNVEGTALNISSNLTKRTNSAQGYRWFYELQENLKPIKKGGKTKTDQYGMKMRRKVAKVNGVTNEIVQSYESIACASRATGIHVVNISKRANKWAKANPLERKDKKDYWLFI